jgi:beta-phosphoglucomutase-like phosphatase (HAD superfamily)
MHNKFKLAVFDIAGTTVRDKDFVAIAFIEAFMHYGIELKVHEIAPLMGFKKTEAI